VLLAGLGMLAVLTGLVAGVDGRLAILGALGVAFVLIAFADLAFGLAIFMFLGFIVVVPNFAGETISIIKLAALPLLLSWLAIVSTREGTAGRNFIVAHPAVSLAMLLFLGWALLSIVWAEDANVALFSVFRYLLAIGLVLVVFAAVQTQRDVTIIIAAMVLGAACAAVYGLLNPPSTLPGQVERLSGTLGNANELAGALVMGIGLTGGLVAIAKSALARGLALGVGALCLIAIFLTGSRGGLIALAAMLIAAVLLARGRRLPLTLATIAIAIVGIGYIATAAPEASRDRVLHPGRGTGRIDIWTVGGRMVSANPVTGVGAGNFRVSSIHYLLEPGALPDSQYIADEPSVAHNTYLEVLAELGIPGALLFVALILFFLGCSISALSRFRALGDRRMQGLTIAITASLIGLLAQYVFGSQQYARELWLLLGLGPALLAMAKRTEARRPA
jgi:O-antigen ligase